MEKLKLSLAKGLQHFETVDLTVGDKVYQIEIRPLRHTEVAEIQALLSGGLKTKGEFNENQTATREFDVDFATYTKNRYLAGLKAAALGTVDPDWTEETIDKYWKTEWIDTVAERVLAISNVARPDQAKTEIFRE